MSKQILLDMDGVLVDFIGGAFAAHGKTVPREIPWAIWEPMGLAEEDFWRPLGFDFWAELDWTEEGQRLVWELEGLVGTDNVCLLSSPCQTPGCAEGKLAWIQKHMPKFARQYLLGPAKQFAASPSRILVDDHDRNVVAFHRAGGRCVLVPRTWNSFAVTLKLARLDTPEKWVRYVVEAVKMHLDDEDDDEDDAEEVLLLDDLAGEDGQ